MYGDSQEQIGGVYAVDEQGDLTLVHEYQSDEYSLEDVLEQFGFGQVEHTSSDHDTVIVLSPKEVHDLKVNADAYSFDYDEGFIQMCVDIERFAGVLSEDSVRLVSID